MRSCFEKREGEGLAFWAAAALATAIETPRMALAPSLPLLAVPSRSIRSLSTASWLVMSRLASISFGPRTSLTLATALVTPVHPHSRISTVTGKRLDESRRTLAEVLGLVTVTELDGLVDTGRSARRDGSAEETCLGRVTEGLAWVLSPRA